MPGETIHTSYTTTGVLTRVATAEHDATEFVTFEIPSRFVNVGTNYLAIQGLSQDDDMFLDVELSMSTGQMIPAGDLTVYTGPITIERDTIISARRYNDETGVWSSMAVHEYLVADPGDANLDGSVDAADLNLVARHWQAEVEGWAQGDFTGGRCCRRLGPESIGDYNWQQSQGGGTTGNRTPRPPLAAARGLYDISRLPDAMTTFGTTHATHFGVAEHPRAAECAEHLRRAL